MYAQNENNFSVLFKLNLRFQISIQIIVYEYFNNINNSSFF